MLLLLHCAKAAPLLAVLQLFWTNFAKHGDPNGPSSAGPPVGAARWRWLALAVGVGWHWLALAGVGWRWLALVSQDFSPPPPCHPVQKPPPSPAQTMIISPCWGPKVWPRYEAATDQALGLRLPQVRETLPLPCVVQTAFAATSKTLPLPFVFPLPSRLRHCLCLVFPLPSRPLVRHCLCLVCPTAFAATSKTLPLPFVCSTAFAAKALLRHCLSLRSRQIEPVAALRQADCDLWDKLGLLGPR